MKRVLNLLLKQDRSGDREGYCRRDNQLTRCCPVAGTEEHCLLADRCFLHARTSFPVGASADRPSTGPAIPQN